MSTLADLVSSALRAADTEMKVASAHDAVVSSDAGFLDSALGIDARTPKPSAKTASARPAPSPSAILDDAAYGLKIAEALDSAADMVASGSVLDLPGPEVQESPFANTPATYPTAQSNLPANEKTHGSGPTGPVGELPTNDMIPGQKSASWAQSKTAALSLINSKVAQAELLFELGQKTAAQVLLNEVKGIRSKLASDPSSPQANISGGGTNFMLPTEIEHTSMVPDNAGMASITKAKAVNPSIQEAGTFISETPKVDNAVPAAFTNTEGQKVSSLQALVKVAARLSEAPDEWEAAAEVSRAARENKTRSAITGGVGLGTLGAATGAAIGGGVSGKGMFSKPGLAGAVIGGALGAGGGAYLGNREAGGHLDSRKRLEQAAVTRALAAQKTASSSKTKAMLEIAENAGKAGGGAVPFAQGVQAAARGSAGKVNRGSFKLAGTKDLLKAIKATEGQAVKPLTRDMLASGAQAAARGSAGRVGRVAGSVAGGIR